jgi:hypothetical protein
MNGCTQRGSTGMARFRDLQQRCAKAARGHKVWVVRRIGEGRHPNGHDRIADLGRVGCKAGADAPGCVNAAVDSGPAANTHGSGGGGSTGAGGTAGSGHGHAGQRSSMHDPWR